MKCEIFFSKNRFFPSDIPRFLDFIHNLCAKCCASTSTLEVERSKGLTADSRDYGYDGEMLHMLVHAWKQYSP
jgi:hypothetical protein